MADTSGKGSLIAGTMAAFGASLCCVGPLVLLALGIGGTWISYLTAMEPYRPVFIALTVLFLGLAFRRLYWPPVRCSAGSICAKPRVLKRQRLLFWLVTVCLCVLLAVPWLAPLFY